MSEAKWETLTSEKVLETPYYSITRDRVRRPVGEPFDYFVMRPHRFAAGVIPTDDRGRVLLVHQWRHPAQKMQWEIPAGAVDGNESPQQAALRELREETGYDAKRIDPLYAYHPSIGTSSQIFHLFVARDLAKVGTHDPVEIHEVRWFERRELEAMIDEGKTADGLTLTALLIWLRANAR
ncbi:MAG TPA: NUDIX hydrolase [Tepidisphaeraceae bacterium]|jgi:8-oxo-dGTP pyrophosphatase MutT (NUDIX family)|nr:NUDIX hydrolase [Tepidisphaeraceae bacterium]